MVEKKHSKIALFHPWIKSRGGAEKVILELLEKSKYDFDVYTWAYDEENTFEEFRKYKINIISPKFGKKLSRFYLLRGLFLPLSLLKKIPLEKYDKFLISTAGLAEFITFRNYKKGKTYAYVHTPLREANKKIVKWNLENKYKENLLNKYFYLFATKIYRIFEKRAWKKLDVIIFNSELSKSRAMEHNLIKNQKTHIIFPPIDFSRFKNLRTKKGNYFLYISRFNPPKRQDILIEAWKKFVRKNPHLRLIIAGTIDNKKYFKKIEKLVSETKNVEIMTSVSNKKLSHLIANCKAGIFFGYQEDFGIIPLEIISAGKPLIAVDEGGFVKLIDKHPLFHKIKEKHNRKEMIEEIEKELENFVKKKKVLKKKTKIKIKDFIKEIDKILEK